MGKKKVKKPKKEYTHVSGNGMLWRFNGSRPVSALADKVMKELKNGENNSKNRESSQ